MFAPTNLSTASPQLDRIHRWQKFLPTATTATLFSTPADITYFTGFEFLLPAEREAYLLVMAESAELWYASFSPLPSSLEVTAKPMRSSTALMERLQQLVVAKQLTELQFDATNVTVAEHQRLSEISNLNLVAFPRPQIWQLRQQKDASELAVLQKVNRSTTQAVAQVMASLQVGQTEQAVAWQLEAALRSAGVTELAFPTIVAFGDHTALPHHQPTQRALTHNTAVLIDVGGRYQNYCADMTRSWWFGQKVPTRYRQIEQAVQEAYTTTVAWIQTQLRQNQPILAKDLDHQARTVITTAGFGQEFIHTTGHGIGIEVHEPPSLSWQNTQPILAGTCLTIEPGIYLPDEFGYRYENTLWLDQSTALELTKESE